MKTLATLALVGVLATHLVADDILLLDGRDILGVRIEKETYADIEYRKAGLNSTQRVATADVREIVYGSAGKAFSSALALRDQGDMVQAAESFMAAADDEELPDHVRHTAFVEAGEALIQSNNLPEAVGLFQELLSTAGSTRHRARAKLGLGRALFLQNDLARAEATFEDLVQDVEQNQLGERWALEAEFMQLWAGEAQGRDVAAGYDDLRSRTRGSYQGIANRCALRLGRVHLAQERLDEAERLFDDIIDSRLETGVEVVASAYIGRGHCRFQAARAAESAASSGRTPEAVAEARAAAAEAYRGARLDFLRVPVHYSGVYREQAEALYWAARSFLAVAGLDESEEDAELQGRQLLARCQEKFPGTEWAERAAQEN